VNRRSGLRPVVGGAPPSDVLSTAAILGLQLPSTLAARASASAKLPQRRNRTGSRGSLLGTAAAQPHSLSVTCLGSNIAPWEHRRYTGPVPHTTYPVVSSVLRHPGGPQQVSHRSPAGVTQVVCAAAWALSSTSIRRQKAWLQAVLEPCHSSTTFTHLFARRLDLASARSPMLDKAMREASN